MGRPTNAVRRAAAERWMESPSGTPSDYSMAPIRGAIPTQRGGRRRDSVSEVPETPDDSLAPASDPVATARRRHGSAGAILAAGMMGIDQVLGRKPREEAPIVIAASDQPIDIDTEGIVVPVDEHTDVVAPPQERPDPFARRPRRRR